jgi:hypothetical protein
MMNHQATSDWQYDAEEHLHRQLLRDAACSLREKLRWLEEAHHTMLKLQRQNHKVGSLPQSQKENA